MGTVIEGYCEDCHRVTTFTELNVEPRLLQCHRCQAIRPRTGEAKGKIKLVKERNEDWLLPLFGTCAFFFGLVVGAACF